MFSSIVKYLRDEVSRVKRQRLASTGGVSSGASLSFLRSLSFSAPPGGEGNKANRSRTSSTNHIEVVNSNSPQAKEEEKAAESPRNSISAQSRSNSVTMVLDNGRPSVAYSAGWVPARLSGSSFSSTQNIPANGNGTSTSNGTESGDPGGMAPDRASLVAAALDRSLSHLIESPKEDSILSKFGRKRTVLTSDATLSKNLLSSHGDPSSPTEPRGWRDKYVMKFSGWQANNPDRGLPPSLMGPSQHQQRSSTIISPLSMWMEQADSSEASRVSASATDLEAGKKKKEKDSKSDDSVI